MRYAILVDGVIENIIWLSDANASDFSGAVKLGDRPAAAGDAYADGKFYHNGVEQLTSTEALFAAQQEMILLDEAIIELTYQNILLEAGVNEHVV